MKREKDIFSPYQINALNSWKGYLEQNSELLESRFRKIIHRYQFENIPNLEGEERNVVEVEFFHGSGDLKFWFSAKTEDENGLNLIYNEDEPLFPEEDHRQYINQEFLYPNDMDVYYEGYRENNLHNEKWSLLFEWLVGIWVKCKGPHIGIVVGTLENNASRTFSLNLLNWDSFIDLPEPSSRHRINYPLIRQLTPFEIKLRVRFSLNSSGVAWRYFEREDEFFEIGWHSNLFSIRNGKIENFYTEPFQIEGVAYEHSKIIPRYTKRVAVMVDDLINQGFFEEERPVCNLKMHPDLIGWDGGYRNKGRDPIEKSDFPKLENQLNIKLPGSYKWFIFKMNNIKPGGELSHFRIAFEEWKAFEEFFNFKNLPQIYYDFHNEHEMVKDMLPIASDKEGGIVLLGTLLDQIFYFSPKKELKDLGNNFENFIGSCTEISPYFCPHYYHIEKENIPTIKRWLNEGGKLSDIKTSRSILQYVDKPELLQLLLEYGANPNEVYIWGDRISRDNLDLMLEYGLDLQAQFENQSSLVKELMERGGFEDLLPRQS